MISADQVIRTVAPRALETYRTAFGCANAILPIFGVTQNERRLAHFLAQVLHESGGLTLTVESLRYSAVRMTQVWPSRFATVASARPYVGNPEKLANNVYGGRLGNNLPGDGWKYIGRGLIQVTGRENYTRIGAALGVDLVADPELVLRPSSVSLLPRSSGETRAAMRWPISTTCAVSPRRSTAGTSGCSSGASGSGRCGGRWGSRSRWTRDGAPRVPVRGSGGSRH